jgi:hypothetical protein
MRSDRSLLLTNQCQHFPSSLFLSQSSSTSPKALTFCFCLQSHLDVSGSITSVSSKTSWKELFRIVSKRLLYTYSAVSSSSLSIIPGFRHLRRLFLIVGFQLYAFVLRLRSWSWLVCRVAVDVLGAEEAVFIIFGFEIWLRSLKFTPFSKYTSHLLINDNTPLGGLPSKRRNQTVQILATESPHPLFII